jgi:hypothetical protein
MADPITFSSILGPLMLFSMIVSPGVQAGVHMDDLRKSIDDANTNYNDLDTKWKSVFKKQAVLDQKMKDDIITTFTNINDSISKANVNHQAVKDQCKYIQQLGIVMILFVFILLLLKYFDLFETLNSIILYPVTFYKNMYKNKN